MLKYTKRFVIWKNGKEDTMSVIVDESESAVNCLMTLYLLKHSDNRIDGITKLQKLTFATQKEMAQEGICAISGEFFRWDYGPMSNEVYGTNDILVENDLVEDRALALTDRGEAFLGDFAYIVENNKEAFAIIDKCIDEFSYLNLRELKEKIYSMMIVPLGCGKPRAIRDLPHGTTILRNKGFHSINIDADDIETLAICLSEEMYQSVLDGIDDARSGRIGCLEIA